MKDGTIHQADYVVVLGADGHNPVNVRPSRIDPVALTICSTVLESSYRRLFVSPFLAVAYSGLLDQK